MTKKYMVFFALLFSVLILIANEPSTASSPQRQIYCPDDAELFRSVEVVTGVRVKNSVRVRGEPGTSGGDGTVLFTAVVDQEFDIREEDSVEAHGFTWIPIVADNEEAWIAQEGFVELIIENVDEPVTQAEIELACNTELPIGTTEIITENNLLKALNSSGITIAIWYWQDEANDGHWGYPIINTFSFENYDGITGLYGDKEITFEDRAYYQNITTGAYQGDVVIERTDGTVDRWPIVRFC